MADVSVVVPVYNERENIPLLCERLHAVLSGIGRTSEAILVDDGSTDGSWEALAEMARKYPRLRLIRFRRNFGQTAAMSAGFRAARGRTVITLDADLQNDPSDIPMLLDRIEQGYDVVSGWRKDRQDRLLSRRLPSLLANALIARITGVRLHDYGCTLKAYRSEIVRNLNLYGEMHRFIPALASWVGGSIDEVVVKHHARRFGRSKYGMSRTLRVILDLITVKFLLRYSTHPIQIFGKIGALFGITGAGLVLGMALTHVAWRAFGVLEPLARLIKSPFWVMTAFMLMFFGVQLVCIGLLAEIQIRTYHESQNKPIYVIREELESAADGST